MAAHIAGVLLNYFDVASDDPVSIIQFAPTAGVPINAPLRALRSLEIRGRRVIASLRCIRSSSYEQMMSI